MKHTPGPWTWACDYLNGPDDVVISVGIAYEDATLSCSDADMALIAAAPDLLAALMRVIPEIATCCSSDMLEQARKAIAKAEGKS